MIDQMTKLEYFASLLEKEQIAELLRQNLGCQANIDNSQVTIKPGKKYIKVNVGSSGKYMVESSTGDIYGIKAYGVIHRGHKYGNLNTVDQWNWGSYHATPKNIGARQTKTG